MRAREREATEMRLGALRDIAGASRHCGRRCGSLTFGFSQPRRRAPEGGGQTRIEVDPTQRRPGRPRVSGGAALVHVERASTEHARSGQQCGGVPVDPLLAVRDRGRASGSTASPRSPAVDAPFAARSRRRGTRGGRRAPLTARPQHINLLGRHNFPLSRYPRRGGMRPAPRSDLAGQAGLGSRAARRSPLGVDSYARYPSPAFPRGKIPTETGSTREDRSAS
jgi:hypothetical protein